VLRHSRASVIDVDLNMHNNTIVLTVKDDGCGFSMDETTEYSGFGLAGMKERALLAGGSLDIIAQKGQGSEIVCSIPIGRDKP